jgi:hypothetical protein
MNETCEVNVAPDSEEGIDCGKPARFKVGGWWMCAEHYDRLVERARTDEKLRELLEEEGVL